MCKLEKRIKELETLINNRFCTKHMDAKGVYSISKGVNKTPNGGGCAICIGIKVESECDYWKEIAEQLASYLAESGEYCVTTGSFRQHTRLDWIKEAEEDIDKYYKNVGDE